jgi:hypothetical protein
VVGSECKPLPTSSQGCNRELPHCRQWTLR